MNFYIVVEGIGDKKIYETWIPLVNPSLKKANLLNEVDQNCFFIISGGGYPNYLDIINNGIETVNNLSIFNRYIISVDSEDFTKDEKYNEIQNHLQGKTCYVPIDIVIQHFCIETWLLGNLKIGPRNPKSAKVAEYKSIYDVFSKDPEFLPPHTEKGFNRSQFALHYLKACLNDKKKGLSYRKGNPKAACHPTYFNEVKKRYSIRNQINSFGDFLTAFK